MEIDGKCRKEPTIAYLDSDTYNRIRRGVIEKGVPKWNWSKTKEPSKLQRKKMVAMAMMVTVRNILENHLYVFNSELYRQLSGGPI